MAPPLSPGRGSQRPSEGRAWHVNTVNAVDRVDCVYTVHVVSAVATVNTVHCGNALHTVNSVNAVGKICVAAARESAAVRSKLAVTLPEFLLREVSFPERQARGSHGRRGPRPAGACEAARTAGRARCYGFATRPRRRTLTPVRRAR
jgi:hypothetical protein